MVAPVVGSASWPTWMALVAKCIPVLTSREMRDDVHLRQDADRHAFAGDDDGGMAQRELLVRPLDLVELVEDGERPAHDVFDGLMCDVGAIVDQLHHGDLVDAADHLAA